MRTKPNFDSATGIVNGDVAMKDNVQQPTMSASVNATGYQGGSESMAPGYPVGDGSGSVSANFSKSSGSVAINAAVPTSNVAVSAGNPAGAAGSASISDSVSMPAVSLTMEKVGGHIGNAEFSMEFQGYGEVFLNAASSVSLPPPSELPSGPPPEMVFSSAATLSEADVRDAFLNYAKSQACYSWEPPMEMTVVNIIPSSSLEYTLETFCESRETKMAEEPYKGGSVDGPSFGPPPALWSIQCQPDLPFQDHEKVIEVPHTTSVRPCQKCGERGYLHCIDCKGSGRSTCGSCSGLRNCQTFEPGGGVRMEPCITCGGDGRSKCGTCNGDGRTTCSNCEGFGKVKNYVKLRVKYHNHKSNCILEGAYIPENLINQVSPVTVFEQTLPQVWPITNYQVQKINAQSQQLVQQHRTAFSTELQRYQRHILREVQITEVNYKWKDITSRFYVYGTSRNVYAAEYPMPCCCTIL